MRTVARLISCLAMPACLCARKRTFAEGYVTYVVPAIVFTILASLHLLHLLYSFKGGSEVVGWGGNTEQPVIESVVKPFLCRSRPPCIP